MRVLVCGGRNWTSYRPVFEALDALHHERGVDFLMAGEARGADTAALAWARSKGVAHACFEACWDMHSRAAGPIRNANMIKYGEPDLVIAFPGDRGTADMVRRAKYAAIEVREVK